MPPYKPSGRFRFCISNTRKSHHLMPRRPHTRGSGVANKSPEEYPSSLTYGCTKMGLAWYYKQRRRGPYAKFPWVEWSLDPVGHTRPPRDRAFSDQLPRDNVPGWNMYQSDGEDFRMDPSQTPLVGLVPVIQKYAGATWGSEKLRGYLVTLQEWFPTVREVVRFFASDPRMAMGATPGGLFGGGGSPRMTLPGEGCPSRTALTISALSTGTIEPYHHVRVRSLVEILEQSSKFVGAATNETSLDPDKEKNLSATQNKTVFIPEGFLLHFTLLVEAVDDQFFAKRYRSELHSQHGVLRTRQGERYYALPHPRTGPAWPQATAQAGHYEPAFGATRMLPQDHYGGYPSYHRKLYNPPRITAPLDSEANGKNEADVKFPQSGTKSEGKDTGEEEIDVLKEKIFPGYFHPSYVFDRPTRTNMMPP